MICQEEVLRAARGRDTVNVLRALDRFVHQLRHPGMPMGMAEYGSRTVMARCCCTHCCT